MFTLNILEVVIGLAFIYMILSLITTTITEFIASVLSLRANNLYRGIKVLLNDARESGLAEQFYNHPLIQSLSSRFRGLFPLSRSRNPSYIPADTFALVVMDLLVNDGKDSVQDYRFLQNVEILKTALKDSRFLADSPKLRKQLELVLGTADTIEAAQKSLQDWFNDTMERASGWYKRTTQFVIYIVAFVVCFAANADTIMLYNRLSTDPAAREVLVSAAERAVAEGESFLEVTAEPDAGTADEALPDLAETYEQVLAFYNEINNGLQIIGWSFRPQAPDDPAEQADYESALARYEANPNKWPPDNASDWLEKAIGLLISAVAVSLGAPFWFDLLRKIINIRNSGDDTSDKTTSNDDTEEDDGGRG